MSYSIDHIPLFAQLPDDEKRYLMDRLIVLNVEAGTVVFNEGEEGLFLYIVIEGILEIVKGVGTPDEYLIAIRGPGDFVGEMSILNKNFRMATVRTREQTKLLKLPFKEFQILLNRQPSLILEMVRELSTRLDEAHDQTVKDLRLRNIQLMRTNEELQQAQTQIIEKERLERELHVAFDIQMSILPAEYPVLQGIDLGATLVPARSVGGDMYDFVQLDDHRVGVVIGDVSDKGVPAAIFMAQTHALFRAEASRDVSPVKVLQRVNQHLLGMNARGLFVTAIYGVIDARNRTFSFARGGHELPLLLHPDRSVREIEFQSGQLLGLFEDPVIPEQTIEIPSGGTLLLYTDGGTDIINADDQPFGIEQLRETLKQCGGLTAQGTCDHIFKSLRTYRQGEPPFDDVTLVAIRVS
jgi:sigma-B regulation protein RsbU (phosphoserine phosphatase)